MGGGGCNNPRRDALWKQQHRHQQEGREDDDKTHIHRRVVSFGTVHIREYPVILSDHPAASLAGPALELGWEYRPASHVMGRRTFCSTTIMTTTTAAIRDGAEDEQEQEPRLDGRISVHDYETVRPSHERRSMTQFYLRPYQRQHQIQRLRNWHETEEGGDDNDVMWSERDVEIAAATRAMIQRSRAMSNQWFYLDPVRRTKDAWTAQFRLMKIRRAVHTMNHPKQQQHKGGGSDNDNNIYHRWWIPVVE
jgi:hypothetical protein